MAADTITDIYNVRDVDATLLTSGQPTEGQLVAAAGRGVQVVINLAPHNAPRALPDEASSVAALNMDYVHIPVVFSAPTEADLVAFFDAMDAHRTRHKLVHCAANKRVTVHAEYIWIECEDAGGPWHTRPGGGRPHGLDVVHALCGEDGWGVEDLALDRGQKLL